MEGVLVIPAIGSRCFTKLEGLYRRDVIFQSEGPDGSELPGAEKTKLH